MQCIILCGGSTIIWSHTYVHCIHNIMHHRNTQYTWLSTYTKNMHTDSVCVCVCEGERERDRPIFGLRRTQDAETSLTPRVLRVLKLTHAVWGLKHGRGSCWKFLRLPSRPLTQYGQVGTIRVVITCQCIYIYTVHVDISYFCCIPSPSHNDAACSSHACKSVIGCIGPLCTSPCGLIKMLGEKKRVSCTTHCPGYVLHHTVCIGNYMYITSHELCLTNLNNTHTHTQLATPYMCTFIVYILLLYRRTQTHIQCTYTIGATIKSKRSIAANSKKKHLSNTFNFKCSYIDHKVGMNLQHVHACSNQ